MNFTSNELLLHSLLASSNFEVDQIVSADKITLVENFAIYVPAGDAQPLTLLPNGMIIAA